MKVLQLNNKEDRNKAQDLIDNSDIGDYVVITNIDEIANRKVFADNLKSEINKMYGVLSIKPKNVFTPISDMMKVVANLPDIKSLCGDTDGIFVVSDNIDIASLYPTEMPITKLKPEIKKYHLISYAWRLMSSSNWHYENEAIDIDPINWITEKYCNTFNNNKEVCRFINSIKITNQQYDKFKELNE